MPMPQRGPCTSTPIIHKAFPLALLPLLLHQHLLTVQHEHSNKRLYQHAIPIPSIEYYLYTRLGGSTELAPPTALRRLRPAREKEKRKAIFQCSQVASVPKKGRSSLIGSSCIQLVHHKAQESQESGRGPWTHTGQIMQTISLREV